MVSSYCIVLFHSGTCTYMYVIHVFECSKLVYSNSCICAVSTSTLGLYSVCSKHSARRIKNGITFVF